MPVETRSMTASQRGTWRTGGGSEDMKMNSPSHRSAPARPPRSPVKHLNSLDIRIVERYPQEFYNMVIDALCKTREQRRTLCARNKDAVINSLATIIRQYVPYFRTIATHSFVTKSQVMALTNHPTIARLYIVDKTRVVCMQKDGTTHVAAGCDLYGFQNGAAAQSRFNTIGDITVDLESNIYVTDNGNRKVRVIRADNNQVYTLCGHDHFGIFQDDPIDGRGQEASFRFPAGITIDSKKRILFVTDGPHVRQITLCPDGVTCDVKTISTLPEWGYGIEFCSIKQSLFITSVTGVYRLPLPCEGETEFEYTFIKIINGLENTHAPVRDPFSPMILLNGYDKHNVRMLANYGGDDDADWDVHDSKIVTLHPAIAWNKVDDVIYAAATKTEVIVLQVF